MKTVLEEDDFVRNQCLESNRKMCVSMIRTLMFIGFPICVGSSVFFYYLDPVNHFQYLTPLLIIPLLVLLFALLPRVTRRIHNRWIISEGVIKVRGHRYGSMRIDKMREWFIKSCTDFPEYYRLTVCSMYGMSNSVITLSEKDFPIERLTELLPKNKQSPEPLHFSANLTTNQK